MGDLLRGFSEMLTLEFWSYAWESLCKLGAAE